MTSISLRPTFDLPKQEAPTINAPLHLHKRSESKGTAHDFWKHYQERPLDAIFRPKSVAGKTGTIYIWSKNKPLNSILFHHQQSLEQVRKQEV